MNRLPSSLRQHVAALRLLLAFTVLCGIVYPVAMWGIAQVAFKNQAGGSLVSSNGKVVGSSLLCQEFVDAKGNPLPQYFQVRPSNATSGASTDYGCDPGFSAAANLGPNSTDLTATVNKLKQQVAVFNHVPAAEVPPDAVTSSASGLDPDISPAYAAIQVNRVAAARHLSASTVESLVGKYTVGRDIGFLGEPGVNVLDLNIALSELKS
ncbi:MAG TPA: potassium-transporting ATPase subunit KdpC [Trebonia sp.]